MKKGLISILIVNWNEKEFLKDCFDSIFAQTYQNYEVIVVDNASTDGSQKMLAKYAKRKKVKYQALKKNLGFSGGNNLAFEKASGEYILLLNADTKFKKNTLKKLVEFFKGHPKADVVQPKLVFMNDNDKLDNVGAYLTYTGIPYYFGLYKQATSSKYNKDLRVYSAKGACMFVRRKKIDQIGFLDDYMFAYFEESDFCHRVWISGGECWYTPSIVVEHFVGATFKKRDNLKTIYMGHRNRIRSFIKNFQIATLIWLLPIHILVLIGVGGVETVLKKNPKKMLYILKAIWKNLLILPDTLSARKKTQKSRKVSDRKIAKHIFKNPRLTYYLHVGGDLKKFED